MHISHDASYNSLSCESKEVLIIISLIKKLLRISRAPAPVVSDTSISPQHIIARSQHRLSKTHISPNALKVIHRLQSQGYQAYLVGGSVRDLLLNHQPKDFDVATNATPNQVKQLFRNARLIGRRFKLVHVWFYRETIEVATFRASQQEDENHLKNDQGMIIRDNVFGSLPEDAWRRDFTINALYYDIEQGSIIDITGGVADIHQRQLRIIGDPTVRYEEDPVRMLRVIRFAAKLNFDIEAQTLAPIASMSPLILNISSARLFEEIVKLYQCGQGVRAQEMMQSLGFFKHLFPQTAALFETLPCEKLIQLALESTDARLKEEKPITPAFIFAVLLWFPLQATAKQLQASLSLPPLHALEQAMSKVLYDQNRLIAIPKRFIQIIREIWLLQYRFEKRLGGRAQHLLTHPRFRAAYDILSLRALAGDAPLELADWWTRFQEVDEEEKNQMVQQLLKDNPRKKRPRKRKKSASKPSA